MKIKFFKYILPVAAALSCTSCLDKYPSDSIPMDEAVNTADDMNQLMIGVYSAFKSGSLYSGQDLYKR